MSHLTEASYNRGVLTKNDRLALGAGSLIATTGIAHFVLPGIFRGATALVFPTAPDRAVMVNGALETVIGTAIMVKVTRKTGIAALGAYAGYLGINARTALKRL